VLSLHTDLLEASDHAPPKGPASAVLEGAALCAAPYVRSHAESFRDSGVQAPLINVRRFESCLSRQPQGTGVFAKRFPPVGSVSEGIPRLRPTPGFWVAHRGPPIGAEYE